MSDTAKGQAGGVKGKRKNYGPKENSYFTGSCPRCKFCGGRGHRVSDCPQRTTCAHCGSEAHGTKRCTFGAEPGERFLCCGSTSPRLPCFWRRFLVPLRRADAVTFDPKEPTRGRADVGLRCTNAALFRSQGLRRNSQVQLCFEASGHVLEVSGALVRNLNPDEAALARRFRAGLDALLTEGCGAPDPWEDPEAWSTSPLRGFETQVRDKQKALKAALKGAAAGSRAVAEGDGKAPRAVVMLLSEDGLPMKKACKALLQEDAAPLLGVVAVIGDDRGLTEEECKAMQMTAEKTGAEVMKVSLGSTTLLASHAIVILHHHLDALLHCCEVPQPRQYGNAGKISAAAPKWCPEVAKEPKKQQKKGEEGGVAAAAPKDAAEAPPASAGRPKKKVKKKSDGGGEAPEGVPASGPKKKGGSTSETGAPAKRLKKE